MGQALEGHGTHAFPAAVFDVDISVFVCLYLLGYLCINVCIYLLFIYCIYRFVDSFIFVDKLACFWLLVSLLVCLFVCLPACLPLCLSVSLSLSLYLSACCWCLFVCLFACLLVCVFVIDCLCFGRAFAVAFVCFLVG